MISRLQGLLLEKTPPQLLIDVNGIAYEVEAPMTTFYHLPEVGQNVVLHTHFVVREDVQLLYGFYDKRDRALFRNLIKVNGIGPRSAISILSSFSADVFVQCVHRNDHGSLVRIPGIGKKTAERLVIEMRDKLESWDTTTETNLQMKESGLDDGVRNNDAVSALVTLGFKPQMASEVVAKIIKNSETELNCESLIRTALKELSS